MNAVEAMLRPLARILNRNIQESTPARELCSELGGTLIAIRVRDTALTAYIDIDVDTLNIGATMPREPDLQITGSLLTLARLNGRGAEEAIRDGSLDLIGDAELASQFQRLMSYARPDIEEELSGVVGDIAAHHLGEVARSVRQWGDNAKRTMGANIREYLQEESRDAPSRYEVEKFAADVGTLRDDVERVEARLNQLQGNR